MSDDNDDREMLAAEFVLGTLDTDEWAQAQTRLAVDADFAVVVARWERRLGELHVMVEPAEPPAHVWERVRARVAALGPGATAPPAGAPAPAAISAEIIDLEERLARWRRVGIVGSALAASLAAFLVLRNVVYDQGEGSSRPSAASTASAGRFVAVLQRDAASPAFLMTVDLGSRTLTVRRVTADRPPGKSYELWLVSPRFPAPRSLGVVGSEEFTVRTALASYDRETIRDATYAISLEPEGGSPTGATTGPILFLGKLLETAPSQSQ